MPRPYPSEIVREAECQARRLTRSFLTQLVDELDFPAALHLRPGEPVACWLDQVGWFNQAQLVTMSSPSADSLEAPLILRVAINHYTFDYRDHVRRRMGWEQPRDPVGSHHTWSYELSLLADQLLDFAPWVAELAVAKAYQDESLLFSPPQACHFWIHPNLLCNYAWTVRAWEEKEQHRLAMERREELRRLRRVERARRREGMQR